MSTIPFARPAAGHWLLGGAAADPALVAGDDVISYGELADR